VPDCSADSCDVVIHATATKDGTSDEATETGTLYEQTLSSFTVQPTSATEPTGADQKYTVTALDQNGKPIAGLLVTADPDANSDADIDSPQTTGTDGKAVFTASDESAETTTFTFKSHVDGNPATQDPQADFTRTATLTTYTPVASDVTVTKDPSFPVYTTGNEYNEDFPEITACFTDQNNNAFTGSVTPIVTIARTIDSPEADAGNTTVGGTATPTGDDGCFDVEANSYPTGNEAGSDVYTVYLEKNGTPGFQSGADLGDTVTVNFGPSEITFDNCSTSSCATQAQVGTVKTITATETTDGQPRDGRTLTFTAFDGATFPATQPSGATRTSDTTATCVTNNNGSCSVNVTDASTGTDEVDVADNAQPNDNPGTGAEASDEIDFRGQAPTLNESNTTEGSAVALYPSARGGNEPNTPGVPGTVLESEYTLRDQNGGGGSPLSNVAVTVHLDHGYFTECPGVEVSEHYEDCSFTPAPADGQPVGAPVNDGQTKTFQTNNSGSFEMYISIGRDAAFDQDGFVDTHPTATVGGTTIDLGNPATTSGEFSEDGFPTWLTDTSDCNQFNDFCSDSVSPAFTGGDTGPEGGPLNGASVQLVPVPGENPTANTADNVHFLVVTRDQFGNLVRDDNDLTASVSGPAELADEQCCGGSDTSIPVVSSFKDPQNQDTITVFNESGSTTAQDAVVTVTWDANVTTWDITGTGDDQVTTTAADSTDKSDSFTAHFYAVDLQNLHYKYSLKPGRIVKVQTTVSDQVTVTDQYNNPVSGLEVDVHRSGPGAVDVDTCRTTNGAGKATYSFSSSRQGNATVTLIVTDDFEGCGNGGSANELSRSTRHIGFDGVPTIETSTEHRNKAGAVTITGHTRPGAVVRLYKKVKGAKHYVFVARHHANVDGDYSFTVNVSKDTRFKVRVDRLVSSVSRLVTVG